MGKQSSKILNLKMSSSLSSSNFPIQDLPDDLLVEVFLCLSGRDLVKSCLRVCKRWYQLLQSNHVWKDKCIRDYDFPCDTIHALTNVAHADFKTVYFLNPYHRNLVKNPDASEGFNHWKITQNCGDRFNTEETPVGCDPVTNYATAEQHKGTIIGCWVTSYGDCYKYQIIDLLKEGCSEEVLDHVRPNIEVSEWYAARFDCGIEYKLNVKLLCNKSDKIPVEEFTYEEQEPAGREWYHAQHTFSGYKPGVRYIIFEHGGRDTQFWAGHYGVKFTLSSVMFDLNHTSGPERHSPVGSLKS